MASDERALPSPVSMLVELVPARTLVDTVEFVEALVGALVAAPVPGTTVAKEARSGGDPLK